MKIIFPRAITEDFWYICWILLLFRINFGNVNLKKKKTKNKLGGEEIEMIEFHGFFIFVTNISLKSQ